MSVIANTGATISALMLSKYFKAMVNRFFKILPLREQNEPTLGAYMQSLQTELLGFVALSDAIQNDARILSLSARLQYLIDHPDCTVKTVKREVFEAINTCNCLCQQYGDPGGDG